MKLKFGAMIGQVLSSILKKSATINYPKNKYSMPKAFRGKIVFDPSRCIGCKLCMRDCPSQAIVIIKVADKKFKAIISLDHCIYCAQCVEVCNKNALIETQEYELASLSRASLQNTYDPEMDSDTPPGDTPPGDIPNV